MEGLQPPPVNPEFNPPVDGPESIGHAQLKSDSFFLISFEPHFGHVVSFSVEPNFWRSEKLSLHVLHTYSYIGIMKVPYNYYIFCDKQHLCQVYRKTLT